MSEPYSSFAESWIKELEFQELAHQATIEAVSFYKPEVYANLIRFQRNRIKRCKWTITRAENLKREFDRERSR